jgi:hypothetical protein
MQSIRFVICSPLQQDHVKGYTQRAFQAWTRRRGSKKLVHPHLIRCCLVRPSPLLHASRKGKRNTIAQQVFLALEYAQDSLLQSTARECKEWGRERASCPTCRSLLPLLAAGDYVFRWWYPGMDEVWRWARLKGGDQAYLSELWGIKGLAEEYRAFNNTSGFN